MTNKITKIPQIRFNDFTEDWEQRKLGEHSQILAGGTPKTQIKEYWEPKEIPWMSSGEINKKRLFSTDNQISKLGFENSSARWVKENSVLIALAGQGKTRGTVAINEIPLTTNQSIAAIEPDDKLDSEFLFQNLEKRYEELRLASSGDGSRGGLNKQIISDIKIIAPSVKEQSKIGLFFKHLDDTIALHQRKLELLKEQKKGFLQKMFPKNGSNVPEIRLSGFTEDWEQRKLGEILIERNEQTPESEEYPLMSFVQGVGVTPKGDRYDRSFLVKDEQKKYKRTQLGDFIYSSNNLETGSIGFNNLGNAVISPVYSIFYSENDISSKFIGIYSTKKDFINKMIKFRQGVVYGQWRIHEKDFLNIDLFIPCEKEQTGILNFFTKIDDAIALHQRKLEFLKQMKKSLLQKMFV